MDSIAGNQPMPTNEKPSFRYGLRQINAIDLVVLLAVAYCVAFWSALVSNPDIEMVRYIYERIGFTAQAQQIVFIGAGVLVFVLYLLTGDAVWTGVALVPGGAYTLFLVWRSTQQAQSHTSVYAVTAVFTWAFLFAAITVANRYEGLQAQITRMIATSQQGNTESHE